MPEISIRATRGPAGRVQARNASTDGGDKGAASVTLFLRKALSYHRHRAARPCRACLTGAGVAGLFKLTTDFKPKGDQPEAIRKLVEGVRAANMHQVLLGVTGSGKTFTMAKVIEAIERPTLVLSHNKTLAAQLYQEFRRFFPDNAVEYFVSYYDYYQPEAYVPQSDTYIEKEATINDEIDRMRHSATRSLFERRGVGIVASVSCIYGLGSPEAYHGMMLMLEPGAEIDRDAMLRKLVEIQYERTTFVLDLDQLAQHGVAVDLRPRFEHEHHPVVRLGRPQPVDARHRGNDADAPALEQRARRRMPHAVDLVVDRGLLLDVSVRLRHVSLRLVVVVVRHEILDRVVGEEAPELLVQLRRQRLVVRQDQRRPFDRLDHLGHREGLAAAGDPEQHLVHVRRPHAFDELPDRLRLIALRLEIGGELEQASHSGSCEACAAWTCRPVPMIG